MSAVAKTPGTRTETTKTRSSGGQTATRVAKMLAATKFLAKPKEVTRTRPTRTMSSRTGKCRSANHDDTGTRKGTTATMTPKTMWMLKEQ